MPDSDIPPLTSSELVDVALATLTYTSCTPAPPMSFVCLMPVPRLVLTLLCANEVVTPGMKIWSPERVAWGAAGAVEANAATGAAITALTRSVRAKTVVERAKRGTAGPSRSNRVDGAAARQIAPGRVGNIDELNRMGPARSE